MHKEIAPEIDKRVKCHEGKAQVTIVCMLNHSSR